jgi:hypothetical protein
MDVLTIYRPEMHGEVMVHFGIRLQRESTTMSLN